MKKISFALAVLALVGTACTKSLQENHSAGQVENSLMTKIVGETDGDFERGSLLVMFNEETAARIADGDESAISLIKEAGAESISPALPIRPKNMDVAKKYGLHRWFTIGFDVEMSVSQMASRIAQMQSVDAVQ
jgi:hypothetical protein